jgi:hypothetical protein
MHVTTRADLVANGSQALFPVGNQAVIVAENLGWNFAAQLRNGRVGGFFRGFFKFEGLKSDQILE